MECIPGWEFRHPFGYPDDMSDEEIAMKEVDDYAELIRQKQLWEAIKKSGQYKPPITPWNPPTQEEVDEEAREKC